MHVDLSDFSFSSIPTTFRVICDPPNVTTVMYGTEEGYGMYYPWWNRYSSLNISTRKTSPCWFYGADHESHLRTAVRKCISSRGERVDEQNDIDNNTNTNRKIPITVNQNPRNAQSSLILLDWLQKATKCRQGWGRGKIKKNGGMLSFFTFLDYLSTNWPNLERLTTVTREYH